MRPLRYLYVLALVMWLGGLAVAGLIVAPTTFGVLENWNPSIGRVLAGQVFGEILRRVFAVAYVAAPLMCVALTLQRIVGPRPKSYGIRMGLVVLMLALTLYAGLVLTPQIEQLQSQVVGPMNQLAVDDPRRVEFDALHRVSSSLVGATLVGGLLLLGWETRE